MHCRLGDRDIEDGEEVVVWNIGDGPQPLCGFCLDEVNATRERLGRGPLHAGPFRGGLWRGKRRAEDTDERPDRRPA
jgi:hypothetical protein